MAEYPWNKIQSIIFRCVIYLKTKPLLALLISLIVLTVSITYFLFNYQTTLIGALLPIIFTAPFAIPLVFRSVKEISQK